MSDSRWHDCKLSGKTSSQLNAQHFVEAAASGGDMAVLPFATADPVFLLHHSYVDYLFFLWQAVMQMKNE